MPIIIENVTHTYLADTHMEMSAIRNITLTINEGEFAAIIGHTGSGKSTLISHMNGILQPSGGRVLVDGMDMSDKKLRKKGRERIGMVFQYPEHQLFAETVKADIGFAPQNAGMCEEEVEQRVRESMRLVGLDYDKFAQRSPFDLSGGEKRRAALAGIIAVKPKYLILDEPMAGLDPSGRKKIFELILQLRDALKCAVVMVSHSMDDAANVAERIIVLERGEIIMDDVPREVFRNAEILTKAGLGLPQAAQMARELRTRGVDVPDGIYKMADLLEFLRGRLELL